MAYSPEKIEELKTEITRVKGVIASIDKTIAERIDVDISRYETQSDIGRRRIDKTPISDLRKLKADYRRELVALKVELIREVKAKIASLKELIHDLEIKKLAGGRVATKLKEAREELEETEEYLGKIAPVRRARQIMVRF
ncbi:MAG: hypothetical protein AB8G05_27480 [Oligoflexales bacterium]